MESYTGALSGLLSKCAGKTLLKIHSPAVFDSLRDVVLKNQEFIRHNTNGKQMYSAALNHYSSFLAQRSGQQKQKALTGDFKSILGEFSKALENAGFKASKKGSG